MTEQNQTQEQPVLLDPSSTTVQDMFAKVLHSRIQSGALEAAITKQVDKLIEETASDVMRSYGEVGKKLRELMAAAITPQLDSIDKLPAYHDFVVNRVRAAAQKFYDTRLAEALDAQLAEIISELPEKVTLSWIIEQIKETISDDCSCGHSGFDLPMIIECERDFIHIYIHDEEEVSSRYGEEKHRYKYQIHLHKGELYSLKVVDKETKAKLSFGVVYGVEEKLFHLYALRGTIELDHGKDPDDYDLHVGPSYD